MSGMLKDKNIVIMGVANKWSIAWGGIAEMCAAQNANLIFTYYGERSLKGIEKLYPMLVLRDVCVWNVMLRMMTTSKKHLR